MEGGFYIDLSINEPWGEKWNCLSSIIIIIIIIIGTMISSSRIDEPWDEMWGCVCLPYRQTSACFLRGDSTEAAPVELHWSKFHIHRYNMSRILCVWSPKQKLRCYGQWPRLSAHNHLSPAAPSLWLGGGTFWTKMTQKKPPFAVNRPVMDHYRFL